MELGTAVIGVLVGGGIGALSKRRGAALTYALWGGGIGLGVSLLRGGLGGGHHVGQLPQSLPTPSLPGQMVYDIDPRTDPLLDPVSRQNLYPAWLVAHWQNGDRKIIMQVQRALGVPADGVVGGGTSAAIRHFQAQNGLQTTGVMDGHTMSLLMPG